MGGMARRGVRGRETRRRSDIPAGSGTRGTACSCSRQKAQAVKRGTVTPCTVYLEAASRSQALFTTKWILRSCGYVIRSTWHEESSFASGAQQSHWSRARLEEMKACDTLVVVREQDEQLPPELGVLVGFAAARKLRVIWVGSPVDLLSQVTTVYQFASVDEFRKELVRGNDPENTRPSDDLLAA
jgi:hypothetical protein